MNSVNRRQFSRSLALGALGAALGPSLRSTALGATAARKMTLALTPGSIGVQVRNQKEVLELASRHGFESVEPLGEELSRMTAEGLQELMAALKGNKLSWAAAGLTVDFRNEDVQFEAGMKQLPSIAMGLQRAGVTRVGTWISPSHPSLTYRQNFQRHANRLRAAARVLKDHGLRLGLEYVGTQTLLTRGRYPFVHTMAETRELIAEIGTGNVGLVLDTWHWWTAGDTEADILALKNEDIVSVDLNDAPSGIPKAQQQDNQRELPAATGVIDAGVFLNALNQLGYDGPVRPEPFNKALNELGNDPACAATIAAMKKAFALLR